MVGGRRPVLEAFPVERLERGVLSGGDPRPKRGGMSLPTPLWGTTSRLKGRVVTSIMGYTPCDIVEGLEADLLVVKAVKVQQP
jgi:hypothetical protein